MNSTIHTAQVTSEADCAEDSVQVLSKEEAAVIAGGEAPTNVR